MAGKTSAVKLGLFIFLGITILVIAIFMIGDKDALFSDTFTVKAYFDDVKGLRSGASVRLSGVNVGTVSSVQLTSDTSGRVAVYLSLVEDIERFIRTDTEASIETEGLVGNKVVVIKVGSASADPVKEGGVIKASNPLSISDIIEETKGILSYTKQMTKDLSEIAGRLNRGEGSIGKLLVDDDLYKGTVRLTQAAERSLNNISVELDSVTALFNTLGYGMKDVIVNVNNVVLDADSVITGIKEGKGVFGSMLVEGSSIDTMFASTIRNIQKTAEDSRLAASRLAENMEALKHNWLFKSYFEERGYWETAESEDKIDAMIEELNEKIELLDAKIREIKALEKK